MVLIYVGFIVIDRLIYNSLARNNIVLSRMYFDKRNGNKLNEKEFKLLLKSNSSTDDENFKSNYEEIYLQNEETNYPLILKYIISIIFLIFSHVFIFFYLPMMGNYNLNRKIVCPNASIKCNNFINNKLIITFYLIHTMYYIFSALQIRHGLLDLRKTSILMKKDNLLYYGIFKIYKEIPFLFELKHSLDWTFTKTSLDIFQWIKLESAHDLFFISRCYMKSYLSKVIGETITGIEKVVFGLTFFLFILLCLVGPIMLFSNLNPATELNNIKDASIKIKLNFQTSRSNDTFILFQASPYSIKQVERNELKKLSKDYISTFNPEQTQMLTFNNVSETMITLPSEYIKYIINTLIDNKVKAFLSFDYRLERPVSFEFI